jgi:cation diffusion facilitator family transporter
METSTRQEHYSGVRKVLWQVLAANLAITLLKVTLGVVTGSLAVVADGFHSLVDTSSNLIGLAAVRLANRPADRRYPYGYQRYETIGALAIGVMLLAAAWEIGGAIISRLSDGAEPALDLLTVLLFALTFPVNLTLVILETRAGRRLNSEILLADAAHTRTDLMVTGSVLISLVGVWLGWPWLDTVVASVVVLLILRAAFKILRDTASWLTDAGFADPDQVEAIALNVPGVLYVHRVRSRGTPDTGFIDLHVKVHPGMSTAQAHAIASEVENRLEGELPGVAEVLVHIEPGHEEELSDWEQIAYDLRQIADGMGLGLHDLHVHTLPEGRYAIELHLEMPGDISLQEGHQVAERFEGRVRLHWPRAKSVITHLEPIATRLLQTAAQMDQGHLEEMDTFVRGEVGAKNLLEMQVHEVGGNLSVAVRIRMPASATLGHAHERAEALERALLERFPALDRVTVHAEPSSGDEE